jgi:hypothetical protein
MNVWRIFLESRPFFKRSIVTFLCGFFCGYVLSHHIDHNHFKNCVYDGHSHHLHVHNLCSPTTATTFAIRSSQVTMLLRLKFRSSRGKLCDMTFGRSKRLTRRLQTRSFKPFSAVELIPARIVGGLRSLVWLLTVAWASGARAIPPQISFLQLKSSG